MNKENKKYELVVGKKRIEVSEEVYKAYYKEREHEKYLEKKALANEYSYEGMIEEGISFEYTLCLAAISPEDEYIKKETIKNLKRAIATLNQDEQRILNLLYYQKLNLREAAKIYGITHPAMIKKRDKIIAKLKKSFIF